MASRYGVFCQGCDEVALTLLDVLDYMEKIIYSASLLIESEMCGG